jgi:hypothetical protein
MGSNSGDQEASHAVTIWEVDKEHIAQMEKRISETTPKLLSIAAGRSTCCIFRVPQSRAGSIYFGALDETSKWGLKKKLSKKKN